MFWYVAVLGIVLAFLELKPPVYSEDGLINRLLGITVTRLIGTLAFLPLMFRFGFRLNGLTKVRPLSAILITVPAFLVVINNFPIIGLMTGNVRIVKTGIYLVLYAVESLSIGLFEEIAFRGVLFPAFLENHRSSTKQIFLSAFVSSAAFGAIHLFNLMAGAGFGGVILQIGYSFLIGGMCSAVLLRTHNVWICVILHTLFDFGGFLTETLGEGIIWDTATVIITAVLGVLVFGHMLYVMLKTEPYHVDGIFSGKKTHSDGEESGSAD